MNRIFISIFTVLIWIASLTGAFGQSCPPGQQYPFHVCPGNNIECLACPKTDLAAGQSILAPGLPSSICIDDERSGNSAGQISMFVQNNGPCASNKLAEVFDPSDMQSDAQNALNAWMGICTPNPTQDCCWKIILTSDPNVFNSNREDANQEPSFTKALVCGLSCDQKFTVLNFTTGFMNQTTVMDQDADGNPCDFLVYITSIF